MSEFVVEYLSSWSDYPDDWYEAERVPTREDGDAYIAATIEADFARQVAEYERQKPRADRARELFEQRKAVLIEAGLWKQEDESFVPMVSLHVPLQEPTRQSQSEWRVRTAAEVDEE